MLVDRQGDPFEEILNELSHEEATVYASYLQHRRYDALAPQDATAARAMLVDLMDRATEPLKQKAEMFRELAELDAVSAADRLSWDDTPEGERLRRYELTCQRTLLRMFELLLKVRRTGEELELRQSLQSAAPFQPAIPARSKEQRPPLRPSSPHRPSPSRSPIHQSKPIRIANRRRSNPILMFRRPVRRDGTATKSSESIRLIWNAKLVDSG